VQTDANGNARVHTIGGQQGQVGFGPSPNSSTPHVIVEFQIALSANQTVLNGGYSPDPQFWSSDPPPPPCPTNQFTTIPVYITNFQGSQVSNAQAVQYVMDADSILAGAFNNQIHLVPVFSNPSPLPGGQFTTDDQELGQLQTMTFPGDRGINIAFVAGLAAGENGISLGAGSHSTLVSAPASGANPGTTVAHEIGHELGLPDLKGSGDQSNLMYFDTSRGTSLSPDQLMTACGNLSGFGTTVTTNSPGQLQQQQGGSSGNVASGARSYLHLAEINMKSATDDPTVTTRITLNGAFPSSGVVDATYSLLFDRDGNSATGNSAFGFSGIDKQVVIHVTGDASVAPLVVTGTLIDYTAGGTSTPLPVNGQLFNQPLADSTASLALESQILVEIPKSALELTADDVPVGVVSQNAAGVQDTASPTFDADLYLDEPALNLTQVSAFVGDPVNFTLQNLHSKSAFTLTLGNQQVLTGTTDANGGFSGTFTVPSVPSGTAFLTARANDGITFDGQASVSLTAPSSLTGAYAPYNHITIFQDPASHNTVTITGQASLTMTGVLYAPKALLQIDGKGAAVVSTDTPSTGGVVVVFEAKLTGNGALTINADPPDFFVPADAASARATATPSAATGLAPASRAGRATQPIAPVVGNTDFASVQASPALNGPAGPVSVIVAGTLSPNGPGVLAATTKVSPGPSSSAVSISANLSGGGDTEEGRTPDATAVPNDPQPAPMAPATPPDGEPSDLQLLQARDALFAASDWAPATSGRLNADVPLPPAALGSAGGAPPVLIAAEGAQQTRLLLAAVGLALGLPSWWSSPRQLKRGNREHSRLFVP
jgi:hypothetical protein